MNGIIGMTELTLDSDLTRSQRESLLLVHSLARSLLLIIDDILDISKSKLLVSNCLAVHLTFSLLSRSRPYDYGASLLLTAPHCLRYPQDPRGPSLAKQPGSHL